ncbi:MAG: FIST N-terminal domain-containing protein [Pseudolabrys sp.]
MSRNGSLEAADLVLYFGLREALACGARYAELRAKFPSAHLVGCSTGGQISGDEVLDDGIAAVALRFESTKLRLACSNVTDPARSRICGETIAGRSPAMGRSAKN